MANCPRAVTVESVVVKDPLHILHLEDSEADAVLVSHELEKAGLHVEAHRVVTREEFTRELDEYHPDVILSDHGLPTFDGFSALKLAKEKCPEIPFIFVAESLHGESALETIKNGASDYILKSQVSQRLVPALRRALENQASAHEEMLRQSEERFKVVARATMDVIYDWDIAKNFLFWNEGFHKTFGYRPEDIQPNIEDWEEKIHPGDRQRVVDALKAAQDHRDPAWTDEYRFRRADGSYACVLGRGYFISDRDRNPVRMVGAMIDVSERRRMTHESELHNRQQSAVAALGQQALSGTDLSSLFLEATSQVSKVLEIEFCCLFEVPNDNGEAKFRCGLEGRADLQGKWVLQGDKATTLAKVINGDNPAVVVQEAELKPISELSAKPLRTGILAIVHGPERPFGILAACSENQREFSRHDQLFVQSVANVLGDAIVRTHAESQLRAGEERLRMLLEGVEDYAIYMLDLEGNVASWNMGAQRIEGFKADEIIGKDFACFFPAEDIERGVPAAVLQKVKTTGRFREDLWQVRKDGTLYWANLLLAALKDDQGRLYGIAKVNHDMTLYKAAQEEIRRLNSTLEQRVRERTAQLEAVNKELETFSYSVSHDLRAPLRHIDGFADMLRQRSVGQLDETSLEYLGIITEATRQMSRLIDALLAFSRMGRAALTKSLLDSNKLVRGVLHDLSYDMEGRKIEWRIETLPQVVADPALLRQVWFNLISNALKYSRVRDVATIEIGSKVSENEITFFIKDNGVGFDMQYVDKLFGVFQRLHGNAEFEGTGIGLANVRRIVQRHGGRVWAEGEPDLGATFYFTLPKLPYGSGPGEQKRSN
ncbi:MAG TPA: PAS domain-containing protein [Candidatus Saccharimonadales bacterium]|nr:PAS domain-containing protein [Candidatus Saccharimonadales bacterium]